MPINRNSTMVLDEVALLRGSFHTFESETNVDPDNVILTITDPDGDVITADTDIGSGHPQLENPEVGVYECRQLLPKLGTWNWDYEGNSAARLSAARRGGTINVVEP